MARENVNKIFKKDNGMILTMNLQSEFIPINILDKCVYCIGGSIARNRGGVNKKINKLLKKYPKNQVKMTSAGKIRARHI